MLFSDQPLGSKRFSSMQSRAPHQIRHRNKNTQTTAHSLSKTQSARLLLLLQYFDSESYKEGKN